MTLRKVVSISSRVPCIYHLLPPVPSSTPKQSPKKHARENCLGVIDGTNLHIARPRDNALQKVVYNGHNGFHALKYQALVCPDGILLHGYGPVEGRRHYWTLYIRSELDYQLANCLSINGKQYCVYGDSGYNLRLYLQVPYQGAERPADERAFNLPMATGRITLDWLFKELKMYWTTMDYRRKLCVLQAPVGTLYIACMLLNNFRTCMYGNKISKYFNCLPPSLEE